MSKLNVLLLCNLPTKDSYAVTVIQHIMAFPNHSRHNIFCLSNTGALPSKLALDRFDVVVIHYSIWITNENYLATSAKERLRQFKGLKVQIRQDEYFSVNAVIDAMRDIGIDVVYTCLPAHELDKVYSPGALPGLRRVTSLTGFVPADMLGMKVPAIAQRPIDVSYRARKLSYWLGEFAVEKWRIVPMFLEATKHHNLVTDLAYEEKDRLYGDKWIKLLTSSKCVLGVESGAGVFDFTGEIQKNVEQYVADHPEASFEEVRQKFFAGEEGKIKINQISPRCFEAAALRTAMVLFEGEYSGILQPWRHYVPLKKDFSNIEEVVSTIRDPQRLQAIADRAYEEIALNPVYSYRHFIAQFDEVIEREFTARGKPVTARPYTHAAFKLDLARSPAYVAHQAILLFLQRFFLGTQIHRFVYHLWYQLPLRRREKIRPLLKLIGR